MSFYTIFLPLAMEKRVCYLQHLECKFHFAILCSSTKANDDIISLSLNIQVNG